MNTHTRLLPIAFLGLWAAGCGKPPPPQGPPADFPVPSVVAKVVRERLEERLPLIGSIRAKDEVRLVGEAEGRVLKIGFEEGAFVKAGTTLFEIDRRKAEARMAEAVARRVRAQADLARGSELLASKTIPPQEFDRLKEATAASEANVALIQATLDDTIMAAPFDGLVGERSVSLGQYVAPGTAMATLTRIDPLEVEFQVPERYLSQLKAGQDVRLVAAAWPAQPFNGKISFLAPALESTSRTLRAKADLDNPDRRLRPGMFGTIELVFSVRQNALVVPEAAIIQQGEQNMVVAVGPDQKARYQPVKAGLRMTGKAEVTEGLAEGDIVVVEGHQKVRPGATILFMPGSKQYGVEPTPPPGSAPAAP